MAYYGNKCIEEKCEKCKDLLCSHTCHNNKINKTIKKPIKYFVSLACIQPCNAETTVMARNMKEAMELAIKDFENGLVTMNFEIETANTRLDLGKKLRSGLFSGVYIEHRNKQK